MSHDCIFCKIISGEVPSAIIFQDERVTAFRDINPAAPTHILIVPNKHIASVEAVEEADESLIGYLYRAASRIAREEIYIARRVELREKRELAKRATG